MNKTTNGVFKRHERWYFYNETGADVYGPYKSQVDAVIARAKYSYALEVHNAKHCGPLCPVHGDVRDTNIMRSRL